MLASYTDQENAAPSMAPAHLGAARAFGTPMGGSRTKQCNTPFSVFREPGGGAGCSAPSGKKAAKTPRTKGGMKGAGLGARINGVRTPFGKVPDGNSRTPFALHNGGGGGAGCAAMSLKKKTPRRQECPVDINLDMATSYNAAGAKRTSADPAASRPLGFAAAFKGTAALCGISEIDLPSMEREKCYDSDEDGGDGLQSLEDLLKECCA